VSQVVFMEIFDNLSTFRFKSSLKTWVYRITINAALNYKKKALRHSAVTYNDSLSTPTLLSAVEASIETEYYKSMIQRLLRCLTDEQRNCVVLRSVAGFSYQKIAHALNIRISAVRSRLKRARKKLFAVKKEIAADAL
ncbi:MAG: RNA polymerase sigma factor, partial [Candidatus Omnitrophota bacterium]